MPVQGQKIKLLYIKDIFEKYTDEDHPLNAGEICEKLAAYGVPAERKAIYKDIDLLIDYGLDICKTRVPKPGFFLASREFEYPELCLLAGAVQAASFITVKKTRQLVEKLFSMMSENEARESRKDVYIDNGRKNENEEIYYNIDSISRAIDENKKISFIYRRHGIGSDRKITVIEKEHKVSPYALIWQDDHYYLVGNNEKYDNLMHLRIDRMKSVKILDEKSRHFSEVSEYSQRFDVADYSKKAFNMFGGEIKDIELSCSYKIIDQVIDRFSDKIFIRGAHDGFFTFGTKALVSDGLVGWILQFGTDMRVNEPAELKENIKSKLAELAAAYNE